MSRVLLTLVLVFLVPLANEVRAQHHTVRFFHSSGNPRKIHDMEFSPDGQHLAVAVDGGPLTIIETSSGDVERQFKVTPFEISFSADGSQVLGIGERATSLLNLRSGTTGNVRWQIPEGYIGCSFKEKSGKLVVDSVFDGGPAAASEKIGKGDEIIAIVSEGNENLLLGKSAANVVELLAGPPGTSVTLRIIPKGTTVPVDIELRRKAGTKNGDRLTLSEFRGGRSAQTCFCRSGNSFALLDANTGNLVSVIRPIDCKLNGLNAVSSDGRLFAWASNLRDQSQGGTSNLALEVFDVATQERTHFATIVAQQVKGIRFSPDNHKVLIGDADRIAVYDLQAQRFVATVLIGFDPHEAEWKETDQQTTARPNYGPNLVDFGTSRVQAGEPLLSSFDISADGTMVAVGSPYGQCSIYSITENQCLATIGAGKEKWHSVEETTFSPDGRWVAFFVEGTLNIVSVPDVIAVPESVDTDLASQE